MEEIMIPVDSQVAKAYREADAKQQRQMQILVNVVLSTMVHEADIREARDRRNKPVSDRQGAWHILNSVLTHSPPSDP
ncbi:hypothetical protein [Roseofilum casamattae]|uniref:CopG-like ribbon-helix-helix domain-containing protein n=1 Tax=Roseofilum casamattae BLCC-M143 TaxID=3022442 RepID=A0ABT7BTR6_9CYAN|nr:hypothetical protein [Roseofilum casamattae]MDJ1182574.1 hypothetical protein [Roseofilum casamattae BLCC-M143]